MQLLKNKKGVGQLMEMLLILPFVIYIVMLTLFQFIGIIAQDGLASYTAKITRNAMTASSVEEALNKIAQDSYYHSDYIVKEIIITNKNNVKTSLKFGYEQYSSGKFNSYVYKNDYGYIVFNKQRYINELTGGSVFFDKIEKYWEIGGLIQIDTFDDLTTNVYSSLSNFSVYTFNGDKLTLPMGTTNYIYASNVQPISNDSKG